MSRQPLPLHLIEKEAEVRRERPNARKGPYGLPDAVIGLDLDALGERPEHAALIAQCSAAWSYVEAEMAVLLGVLLGANSDAAIAVYQTLRRATARVDAIKAAAQVVLTSEENELLKAVLLVHQSAEAERNALVHGCFIAMDSRPDVIVWVESSKVAHASVEYRHSKAFFLNALKEFGERIVDNLFYYTINDLKSIVAQIKLVHQILRSFVGYLMWKPGLHVPPKQEQFDQLYNSAPIQEAVRVLRARGNAF